LAGIFGAGAEVCLSAGDNCAVIMVVWKLDAVGCFVLATVKSLVLVIRLSFTLLYRLFQPLWFEYGFLILG
jgi:hypothetical protein